jgi:phospholipid/cholesterol/gamma-HCH transport system substrate-binding protein
MKKETGNSIKLGVFVTIGLLLFVTGIYFIGQKQQLFNTTFRITAIFRDVGGLQVGNNVRFAGINVGTIEQIAIINDTSVKVDMIIDENVHQFIKKDAMAMIGSDGLMGGKIMNIAPGTEHNTPIAHNDIIRTTQPISMDEVFGKLKLTVDNAAVITTDLAAISGRVSSGKGTIGKLFMDTVMASHLDRTLINIERGSKGFQENMDATKNSFLLRGYFRKQQKKAEEKAEKEAQKAAEQAEKDAEKEKKKEKANDK